MRKILCSVIIILLICNIFKISYAEELEVKNNSEENKEINQTTLNEKKEELQGKIDEAEQKLENVESELSKNLQELQELDTKIVDAELKIQKLTIEIKVLQTEVDKIEKILNEAERIYNIKKEIYEQRLIAIYEQGETSYLEILLNSDSIIDFFTSYYLITQMAKSDAATVEELEKEKNKIEIQKEKVDKQKEALAVKKQNQAVSSRILENTKGVRENYVSRLSEKEKIIQADID